MTAGLPGTGIGGIFYFLLAICMPICESLRTLQRRTSFRRWGIIILQLAFVFGILATMWGEIWLLNTSLIWIQQTFHINLFLDSQLSLGRTKAMAVASALASFISLMLVMSAVYVIRFFVNRSPRPTVRPVPLRKPVTRPQAK